MSGMLRELKSLLIMGGMFGVLFFQGCVSNHPVSGSMNYRRLANEFASRNPVGEAKNDFDNGSFEIYSAMSLGLYYPGLDIEVGEAVVEKFGVKHLSGTTDAIQSNAHRDFNLEAFHFGSQYNRTKMKLLRDSGKL